MRTSGGITVRHDRNQHLLNKNTSRKERPRCPEKPCGLSEVEGRRSPRGNARSPGAAPGKTWRQDHGHQRSRGAENCSAKIHLGGSSPEAVLEPFGNGLLSVAPFMTPSCLLKSKDLCQKFKKISPTVYVDWTFLITNVKYVCRVLGLRTSCLVQTHGHSPEPKIIKSSINSAIHKRKCHGFYLPG